MLSIKFFGNFKRQEKEILISQFFSCFWLRIVVIGCSPSEMLSHVVKERPHAAEFLGFIIMINLNYAFRSKSHAE